MGTSGTFDLKNEWLMPRIYYGNDNPLVYVVNQKAGCTLAKHFIYRLNTGQFFGGGQGIHRNRDVGMHYKVWGRHHAYRSMTLWDRLIGRDNIQETRWLRRYQRFVAANPPVFSLVRNPVDRVISGFVDKILIKKKGFQHIHDHLKKDLDLDVANPEHLPRAVIAFTELLGQRGFTIVDRHFRLQTINLGRHSGLNIHTIIRLDDKEKLRTFFASHIGESDADVLLARRFNTTSDRYPKRMFMSDELEKTVRRVFAPDYEAYFRD
jgi:Sulfotransferase family